MSNADSLWLNRANRREELGLGSRHDYGSPMRDDKGGNWGKRSCKYYQTCGTRFNCRGCTGYERG